MYCWNAIYFRVLMLVPENYVFPNITLIFIHTITSKKEFKDAQIVAYLRTL